MVVEMLKMAGGVLPPLDDEQAEALSKFKTGEQYQVEIMMVQNIHILLILMFRQ